MSAYLIDYPFAGRLFPSALQVLRRLKDLGPTVILSDGDVWTNAPPPARRLSVFISAASDVTEEHRAVRDARGAVARSVMEKPGHDRHRGLGDCGASPGERDTPTGGAGDASEPGRLRSHGRDHLGTDGRAERTAADRPKPSRLGHRVQSSSKPRTPGDGRWSVDACRCPSSMPPTRTSTRNTSKRAWSISSSNSSGIRTSTISPTTSIDLSRSSRANFWSARQR